MKGRLKLGRREAERMASQAFSAHTALIETEQTRPELARNPYWRALRDSAFARFRALFDCEAMK